MNGCLHCYQHTECDIRKICTTLYNFMSESARKLVQWNTASSLPLTSTFSSFLRTHTTTIQKASVSSIYRTSLSHRQYYHIKNKWDCQSHSLQEFHSFDHSGAPSERFSHRTKSFKLQTLKAAFLPMTEAFTRVVTLQAMVSHLHVNYFQILLPI